MSGVNGASGMKRVSGAKYGGCTVYTVVQLQVSNNKHCGKCNVANILQ